ncbi:pentatricopeptide repeat-containing protein At3g03580 [Selaginella moellendorffii]|uniref:pentatricopeptide repeat-containing protein At3g03580 n=1 Tax=Selaginella moellendorffii TaxID=88036 RepID=UPI000D1CC44B|nr:pentatricopeptide repeat-containing protein At3g03580 [Selaginella moellendorffii]|eukprot:XP_024526985.1 pentatricopeptide repeat-containing protein At3g03580 [Selaginella moellendorffii]
MQARTKLLFFVKVPVRWYTAKHVDHALETALNSVLEHTKEAYLPLLRACDKLSSLRKIHQQMIQKKVLVDKLLKNVLIDMYGKCGGLDESRAVFQSIQDRDGPNVFSWTVLISAYARNGHNNVALDLFHRMELAGVRASEATLVIAVGICSKLGAPHGLRIGKRLHQRIEAQVSMNLMTALLDMYSKCGCQGEAREIFQSFQTTDSVWWTAMMDALVRCGDPSGALNLRRRMAIEGIPANTVTFVVALTACSCCSCGSLSRKVASQIHDEISSRGLDSNPVLASALVSVYGKHDNFQKSWKVFQDIGSSRRSLSCWNSMVLTCARHGFHERVLDLYSQMSVEGSVVPDEITFSIVLSCCQRIEDGEKILSEAAAAACDQFDQVRSAAIDFYARIGDLGSSKHVFEKDSHCRSLSCWNALIGAYSHHGYGRQSLDLVLRMKIEGVMPDQLTFMSAMFASSHTGLVERGLECFLEMEAEHGIVPSPEHCRCLIDLLGRAGQIEGAEAMLEEDPCEMEWSILVGARKNLADEEALT